MSEMKNGETYDYVVPEISKKDFIKLDEWYKIEEELGLVTYCRIEQKENDVTIFYTTNGKEKAIYLNGSNPYTILIQSFLYCCKQFTL